MVNNEQIEDVSFGIIDPTPVAVKRGAGIISIPENDPIASTSSRIHRDEEPDDQSVPTFSIISEQLNRYENMQISGLKVRIRFNEPPIINSLNDLEIRNLLLVWLHQSFNSFLEYVKSRLDIQPHDKVGFKFLSTDRPSFNISFRRFDQYSTELILDSISALVQSNQNFFLDEMFCVEIDLINMPIGMGKRYLFNGCTTDIYANGHPKALYMPKTKPNHEFLCLAYALVLGKVHVDDNKNLYNTLTYTANSDMFYNLAIELCESANVDLASGGGIDELNGFQNYFYPNYQIIVFEGRRGRNFIYKGLEVSGAKKIYLLLENNHYLLVKTVTGAFSLRYFCEDCLTGYGQARLHAKCPYTCPCCYNKPPCRKVSKEKDCSDGNRKFRGDTCYIKHKAKTCNSYKVCNNCLAGYTVTNVPHG